MNQYTIAGVGAALYFSRSSKDHPAFPIARTLKTLLLHHIGSIAVGSFLIALVATVRTIILYLSKQAKDARNETLKTLLACVQCCLGCLQKLVEFIAERAYIMMAIHGKNFWVSSFDALKLMLDNPLRSALLTAISKLLIVMAMVFVTGVSVLVCFVILRPNLFSESIAPFFPVLYWWFILLICAIIAFFVVWLVFQVYEFLIDTIFMCFLYDEHLEHKYGDEHLTYASDDLREFMDIVDNNALEEKEKEGTNKKKKKTGAKKKSKANKAKGKKENAVSQNKGSNNNSSNKNSFKNNKSSSIKKRKAPTSGKSSGKKVQKVEVYDSTQQSNDSDEEEEEKDDSSNEYDSDYDNDDGDSEDGSEDDD